MTAKWVKKEVPEASIKDGVAYFLAMRLARDWDGYLFCAERLNGKTMMSAKACLAIQFNGNDKLRTFLRDNPDHVCIEVPADADKRWR